MPSPSNCVRPTTSGGSRRSLADARLAPPSGRREHGRMPPPPALPWDGYDSLTPEQRDEQLTARVGEALQPILGLLAQVDAYERAGEQRDRVLHLVNYLDAHFAWGAA